MFGSPNESGLADNRNSFRGKIKFLFKVSEDSDLIPTLSLCQFVSLVQDEPVTVRLSLADSERVSLLW